MASKDINVILQEGEGTTEGEPTWYFEYSDLKGMWSSDSFLHKPSERELIAFKMGIFAERNRIWDRLASAVDDQTFLNQIDKQLF